MVLFKRYSSYNVTRADIAAIDESYVNLSINNVRACSLTDINKLLSDQ